ncbi:hypothetical protein OXX59_004307 [Metschnikowia pulcherrima]
MYSKKVSDFINQAIELSAKKKYEQAASKYADACAAFKEENTCDNPDLLVQQGKMLFEAAIVKKTALGGIDAMRAKVAAEKRANLLNHPEEQDKDEGEKSDDDYSVEDFPVKDSSVKDSSVKNSSAKNSSVKNSSVGNSSVKEFLFVNSSAKESFDKNFSNEGFSDEDSSDDDSFDHDSSDEDCFDDDFSDIEWEEEDPTEFEAAEKVLEQAISLYEKEYSKHEGEAKSLTEPYLDSDTDVPKSKFVEIVKKLAETYDLLGDVMTEVEKPQCSSDHYDECLHLYQKLYHKEFSGHVAMAHYNYAREAGFFYDAMDDAAKHIKQAIRITANLRKVGDWEAKRSCTKLLIELDAEYTRLTRDIQPELDEQDSMTRALMSQFMSLGP